VHLVGFIIRIIVPIHIFVIDSIFVIIIISSTIIIIIIIIIVINFDVLKTEYFHDLGLL